MTKSVNKAYRFRMYPTLEQQTQINKTIGCARWVYNHFLDLRMEAYKTKGRGLTYPQCSAILTKIKSALESKWLAEVDKFALQNSLKDLDTAYKNFFEGRANYPKFKSKRGPKQSYQTNFTNGNIQLDTKRNRLKLPKLGWVKFSNDGRKIPGKIINVTVSRTPAGKYYASVLCETKVESIALADNKVGLDLGIKLFAILSNGETIENPKHYVNSQKKLEKLQRKLSRKKKGSKNYEKARTKAAKHHEKVANQRRDFQHKLSKRLIDENQVIVLEDLKIKNMVKNRRLAKAIYDTGWSTFRRMVEYKATWYGRTAVTVDSFYPSSKLCSKCGTKNAMLTLSDREWQCPVCRTLHDRDENSAKNILAEGLRLLAG